MQSYLQYRRIRQQLEAQINPDEDKPTKEPELEQPGQEAAGERPRSSLSGTLEMSQHLVRLDMENPGEIERADFEVEIGEGDIATIHTREAMGNQVNLRVTGVPRDDGDKILVVSFEGNDDPMDPHNWPYRQKLIYTVIISLAGAAVEFGTVVDSHAFRELSIGYGHHRQVRFLIVGIYLIGLGIGSVIMGPLSEVVGRNPVYLGGLLIFMLWDMAGGLFRIRDARIVCRAISGLVGSAPIICSTAAIADIWLRLDRVYIFPFYSCIVFSAPLFASVINGAMVERFGGRPAYWTTLVFAFLTFILILFFLPETYSPVLLQWKAKHLRNLTDDSQRRYVAPIEVQKTSFGERLRHALYRPFIFIVKEPVITLLAGYMALGYVIIYMLFAGFSFLFTRTYGFGTTEVGLSFFALVVGIILCGSAVFASWRWFKRAIAEAFKHGRSRLDPEISLFLAMLGGPMIPVAVFWMAWTIRPSISPLSPLAASTLFGYGAICVLISMNQYVTDSFERHVASAQASVTVTRYISAGCMCEVAIEIYRTLGPGWTLSILGFLSAVMVPVPFLIYRYGRRLRRHSSYALG